jgi:hypothetical protein
LNLQPGFSLETKVQRSNTPGWGSILRKEKQYDLRIDPPDEGNCLSLFVYVGGQWEPRVRSLPPTLGNWYHIVATWDGSQLFLWVNGLPLSTPRVGGTPPSSDAPLMIGGACAAIEYVKIYGRTLSPKEVMTRAFGVTDAAPSAATSFDFAAGTGLDGWAAQNGATMAIAEKRLVVGTTTPNSLIVNNRLGANIDKKAFVSLRMSVDKGSQAKLAFVTSKGAGQIAFQTYADGKPHAYVIEPRTRGDWGGDLLALGLIPAEIEGSTARIDYLHVGEEPRAAPEIQIDRIFTDSTLPHAQRPERIMARLRNAAGPAQNLTATLSVPEGVRLKSPASQTIASLGYSGKTELVWEVEAAQPVTGPLQVTLAGPSLAEPVSAAQTVAFHVQRHLEKASYVPVPVPAKTKYTIWAHYCALWKQDTHIGWKAIEPWPERKPVLGWYDEGTPEVADWHIKYMLEHGISGAIYCWYRSNLNAPATQSLGHALDDGLLKARYLSMIKFGIMWENGCAQGVASADDLMKNVLPFWIDHYFSNPSYIRIDGKPVLYIWVPSNLRQQLHDSETVRKTLDAMRAECKHRGLGGLYIVGCVQSQDKAALQVLAKEGWDASSAYGNAYQPPAKVTTVGDFVCAPAEGFVDQQESLWRFKRQLNLLPDITVAMMGWDPRPWHKNGFFWSENTSERFRDLCRRTKTMMDSSTSGGPEKNTAVFCCWNEFGEGHYIEPTRGNGFSYLDAIRDVFCEGPKEHTDLAPEDVGRGPLDSWYQAAKKRNP